MKNISKLWMLTPLAALAVACGKTAPADDSLKNDLALASQAQQFTPPQVMSPAEQGYAANPYTAPVRRTASAPVRTTTVRRSSSSSSGASRSSGPVYYPAPAPQPVVKHTQRDAAIGAAAGAVIGATTSRDKVKGGLIGAAAGAILGGVIGNNVDIKKP